jgi:hypothetical protein
MGTRRPETMAKRARELALQEKRERKRQKKADASQQRDARNASAAIERAVDQLDAPSTGVEAPSVADPSSGNGDR